MHNLDLQLHSVMHNLHLQLVTLGRPPCLYKGWNPVLSLCFIGIYCLEGDDTLGEAWGLVLFGFN